MSKLQQGHESADATDTSPRPPLPLQMPPTPPPSHEGSPLQMQNLLTPRPSESSESMTDENCVDILMTEWTTFQDFGLSLPSPRDSPPRPHDTQTIASDTNPQEAIAVSISTSFHPNAGLLPVPTDMVFLSSDGIFFYVHKAQIANKSANAFNNLVPPDPPKSDTGDALLVTVPDLAVVLNIVLHAVYDISCQAYRPDIDTLAAAVDAMAVYGLALETHITPSQPLYSLILNQAPVKPLVAYALAARHDLHTLAVSVSTYLLSFPLRELTEADVERIGPLYLKRLFFLHLGRLQALRALLVAPPHPHGPTETCGFAEQKRLVRAWALSTAYLAWDARPDITSKGIEAALGPLADYLSCHLCKQGFADRVRQVVVQWAMVKSTI